MKKLFKYEINESIAAQATMNCLKNRNTPKTQEQEEGTDDKETFALKLVKKFKNKMTPDYAKRPEMFMMLKLQKALKKPLMSLSKEEYHAWAKAICNACESVFGSAQEQEETDYTNDDIPSYHFSYQDSFLVWAMRNVIPCLRKMSQVCAQADPTELKHAVMKVLREEGRFGAPESERGCKHWAEEKRWKVEEFLGGSTQEQEEVGDDKFAIAKQVMANYNPDEDEYEDPEVWLLYAIQEHIGKMFLKMPKKEVKSWKQAIDATIEEYEFQNQQEDPEDADRLQSQLANAWDEGMEDDEDDYVPYENKFDETHNDIVDSLLVAVDWYFRREADVEGFNHFQYTDDQIGKAVEQILDKYGDFPSSNNSNKCHAWVRKHAEELMKILETGSLENTYEGHPEFDFSEQEEMPQMERRDMILALTQYLDESWIDASEDGDLEELYYAVSDYLDSTGDYPASADWEDCESWCEEHYQDIQTLFLGGSL